MKTTVLMTVAAAMLSTSFAFAQTGQAPGHEEQVKKNAQQTPQTMDEKKVPKGVMNSTETQPPGREEQQKQQNQQTPQTMTDKAPKGVMNSTQTQPRSREEQQKEYNQQK